MLAAANQCQVVGSVEHGDVANATAGGVGGGRRLIARTLRM